MCIFLEFDYAEFGASNLCFSKVNEDKPLGAPTPPPPLDTGGVKMYSMGACAVLGKSNQNALSENLESDPFLNSALQRFTCELYYRFGSFLAPLSVGLITSRQYLSERNSTGNENGRANRDDRPEKRDG